jgi:hypothetical protein
LSRLEKEASIKVNCNRFIFRARLKEFANHLHPLHLTRIAVYLVLERRYLQSHLERFVTDVLRIAVHLSPLPLNRILVCHHWRITFQHRLKEFTLFILQIPYAPSI